MSSSVNVMTEEDTDNQNEPQPEETPEQEVVTRRSQNTSS